MVYRWYIYSFHGIINQQTSLGGPPLCKLKTIHQLRWSCRANHEKRPSLSGHLCEVHWCESAWTQSSTRETLNTSSIDRCSNMFQHVEIDFLWLKTFQHVSTCFHLYGGKHVDEILHQTVWSLPSQKSTESSAPRVPRNSTASVQNPHHSRKYWLVYKFFHGLSILEDDNMSAIILDSLPYPHIPWNSS